MTFMPGKSGNPNGRPRTVDPRSQDLQEFCREHQQDIKKVGEIALKHAVQAEEPWAVKLCMEYFYPKPGTAVFISKEENKQIDVNLGSFADSLSLEDKQAFLKMWMRSKKGRPAFTNTIEADSNLDSTDGSIN